MLLGDQAVASTPDSNSGGLSEAFGFTATASGTATSASVYLDSTAGVSVGLYADSAGRPGTLLSTGTVGASTAHTWATVSLSPAVQIASGTRYWIALQGPGTGPITYHDSGSSGSNLDFSGTGLASPYSTTGQWSSNPVSAYVSGTPSTTTTTTTTTPTTTTTTTPTTTTTTKTTTTTTPTTTTTTTTKTTTTTTPTTTTSSTTSTSSSTTTSSTTSTVTPPSVSILAPVSGDTVSGTIPVSALAVDNVGIASVQFYLDNKPLGSSLTTSPYAIQWDTTTVTNGTHTLTAVATNLGGRSTTSAPITVTVSNPAPPAPCFVQDADVTVNGQNSVTTPSFTNALAGDVLLAFVSADGPATAGGQTATVSGAGLTWKLVARENASSGDAEIWTATAPTQLANVTVTSTLGKSGFDQSLSVVSYQMSDGVGASAIAAAKSGAPTVTLDTTGPGSLVFAVGHDWDNAISRTLAPNQTLLYQFLDNGVGDTTWSQYTTAVIPGSLTPVTMSDTAPTGDQWDLAAVELTSDDG